MATTAQLIAQAQIIKNETIPGANTALRMGEMFENIINSSVNNSLTYVVRMFQNGTSDPELVRTYINTLELNNYLDPEFISVRFFRDSVGEYRVRIISSYGALSKINNGYSYDVSFSDNKSRVIVFTNGVTTISGRSLNYTDFTFRTYTPAGVLADSILQFTSLSIKYYEW